MYDAHLNVGKRKITLICVLWWPADLSEGQIVYSFTNKPLRTKRSLVSPSLLPNKRERERESVWGDMMEEGLLLKERLSERGGGGWREIWEEMKRLSYIAGPLVSVTLSFFLLSVVSLMMVGHLGELALSSTAIAISFAGVTGFSLLVCTSLSLYLFLSFFFFFV